RAADRSARNGDLRDRVTLARSLILTVAFSLSAASLDEATRKLSRDIFQQLIEINTTHSSGSTTLAAQAMAKRFADAGFPESDMFIGGPTDGTGNLGVRLRGTRSGALKPILIICHLDVVEARRPDWTTDPFQF